MTSQTLTIKLRNPETSATQIFTLPRARLLLTSSYFRAHINETSPSKHRAGVVKLNFPDFVIFAIYAEWLHSGEIFTKASLRALRPSAPISPPYLSASNGSSPKKRTPEQKAKDAYTDYLGAYFLGDWVRDITFKDSLVSLIIDKLNDPSGEGYPQQFVQTLRPSLVDLVWMASVSREGRGVRALVYAAIARFGRREDLQHFVGGFQNGETLEEYPKEFVQGLTLWMFEAQKTVGVNGRTEVDGSTVRFGEGPRTVSNEVTPFFESPASGWWSNLWHVACPSMNWDSTTMTRSEFTTAASAKSGVSGEPYTTTTTPTDCDTSTASAFVQNAAGGAESDYRPWPRTPAEHCFFHAHTYVGEPCHRTRAAWDVETQAIVFRG